MVVDCLGKGRSKVASKWLNRRFKWVPSSREKVSPFSTTEDYRVGGEAKSNGIAYTSQLQMTWVMVSLSLSLSLPPVVKSSDHGDKSRWKETR